MQRTFLLIISLCLLSGCGSAFFAVNTTPSAPTDIPIILLNTNFYAEIGQAVPEEAQADFDILLAKVYGEALFTGSGSLDVEIRLALVGDAAVDSVLIKGQSKPQGWDQGTVVFNQSVSGNNVVNTLESSDIKAVINEILEQGNFWINVRVRYAGPGIPQTATIQNTFAYIEGEKNLGALSPLLNLSF